MTDIGDLNLKFPLVLVISVFMSSFNFMISRVEHTKVLKPQGLLYGVLTRYGSNQPDQIQKLTRGLKLTIYKQET